MPPAHEDVNEEYHQENEGQFRVICGLCMEHRVGGVDPAILYLIDQ